MATMQTNSNSEAANAPRIPIVILGWSLAAFLAVAFSLCAIFAALFSWDQMFAVWLPLLPGVTSLSFAGFLLALVETVIWGWFIAVVFGSIFNFFSKKLT